MDATPHRGYLDSGWSVNHAKSESVCEGSGAQGPTQKLASPLHMSILP